MENTIFLEILLKSDDFQFSGRDEIEDPLDEALQTAQLGEVTGGGTGRGKSNIDVEITDLNKGLVLIRNTLKKIGVPRSTVINQYEPKKIIHKVYEE